MKFILILFIFLFSKNSLSEVLFHDPGNISGKVGIVIGTFSTHKKKLDAVIAKKSYFYLDLEGGELKKLPSPKHVYDCSLTGKEDWKDVGINRLIVDGKFFGEFTQGLCERQLVFDKKYTNNIGPVFEGEVYIQNYKANKKPTFDPVIDRNKRNKYANLVLEKMKKNGEVKVMVYDRFPTRQTVKTKSKLHNISQNEGFNGKLLENNFDGNQVLLQTYFFINSKPIIDLGDGIVGFSSSLKVEVLGSFYLNNKKSLLVSIEKKFKFNLFPFHKRYFIVDLESLSLITPFKAPYAFEVFSSGF